MIRGLIIRVTGIAFTLIEVALLIRLLLPFIGSVPEALVPFVKPLMVFFPKGDRERGITQLRAAAERLRAM